MKIQQLSLFVENKPGHTAAPARLLANEGIDIRALSLADTADFGVLRLIVSDRARCIRVLKEHGLAEGVSTRLLIYAGKLIAKGLSPREACRSAVVWSLTDDPELQRSIEEVVSSIFE